ncbi:iron-containing alcohol dehydrogenase [Novosphingobium sp. Chol11]|uniref:iron-containing alcohol dehydrogenase n=1 Tax=Novosphingobium sp. Chol11 TaxID=1385763 RepID=UPI0025F39F39|nr:iron-containing alcohol dehydrogenase [Novosphingobium sp. Chol11]
MTKVSHVVLTATEAVSLGMPAAEAVANIAQTRDARRVFILASSHLNRNTDEIRRIEAALGARHAATHDGIQPHAPREDVLKAAARAREVDADFVVTVGGGSVTDAGKILLICLKHDITTIEQFDEFRVRVEEDGTVFSPQFAGPDIRAVCVPTTLSGGEFNPLSGATDERIKLKQAYVQREMVPVMVVLDPAITVHTPEWLWLSTGVRSVDHATETLASFQSNDFADGLADSALRLLAEGLPRVKADPTDLDARLKCQIGAWQSMIPIIAGVPMGASHAIGHVLGGTCDVPHGHTSCVMSPFVQAYNLSVNAERQKRISACLGDAGRPASELLDALIRGLGMPRSLAEVGVTEAQLPLIAEYTLEDIWGRTNPRPITCAEDVMAILRTALV